MTANTRLKAAIAEEHPEWVIPRECQAQAHKTGIYLAIITGLITIPISKRLGLDKNKVVFSALGVSSISGYATSRIVYRYCRFNDID
ncbi:unnamed protein product [Cunninghamella blakesleeana]